MAVQPDLKTLKAILVRYKVHIAEANDLLVLQKYNIAVIADDSGSMMNRTNIGTRWSELKDTLTLVIEIACCFDADGVDVYFLNRGGVKGVAHAKDPRLESAFASGPSGGTPLAETISRVIRDQGSEKPLLLLVATDGVPDGGVDKVSTVIRQTIKDPDQQVRYQLLPCSDLERDIAWMNDLDEEFPEVDATDDYETEKAEVLRAGLAKQFDRSDWIMKALLGPVSKKFDAWDERTKKSKDDPCAAICCIS